MSGPTAYLTTFESRSGDLKIQDLNGVSWHDAPAPGRWHRCWIQTRGWRNYFDLVCRCACGAISHDGKHWTSRNERRRA